MVVVAAYFTNWSIYSRGYTPAQMPLDKITHVVYAFFLPNSTTGSVDFSDAWADVQKQMENGGIGCIGEFQVLKKRYPHLRVIASIGGFSYSSMLATVMRNPLKRENFVNSAIELMHRHKFDGIDIDWEFPESKEDGEALSLTIKELRERLGPNPDLMVAAPAGPQKVANFPMDLDQYVTCYNLMTYDFTGFWSSVVGHQAQLHGADISVDTVVASYSQYIDPSKLVVGIPLYGRSFANTHGLGTPFSGNLSSQYEAGIHDFKTLPLPGFEEFTDPTAGAAYCQNSSALVSYDNAYTVAQKAQYVKDHALGGGMFWEASGDKRGNESLIATFANAFNLSSSCTLPS